MAATSFSLVAEDDLSCPVCFSLLKDPNTPKELDCSHICCAPCIQKMIEGGKHVVECPECRHVTRITNDGVDAMKTAYRLRSLAEKHHEHNQKEDEASTNDDDNSVKGLKPKDPPCPDHNLVVDLFYKKCNAVGCSACMWYSHKGAEHKVCDLATVHQEQTEHMLTNLNQLDANIEMYEQSIKRLDNLEKNMRQMFVQQREDFVKNSDLIIEAVKESVLQLQESYDSIEQPKIERVHNEKLRLQKQVSHMRDVKSSVQSAMDTCEVREYAEQHAAISRSVNSELENDCQVPKDLDPVIGKARLGNNRSSDSRYQVGTLLQVKTCELKQTQEFGVSQYSPGNECSLTVAETTDGLLVIRYDNNTLKTYRRSRDGEYKRESVITLSKKIKSKIPWAGPWGFGVSFNCKFLVIRGTVVKNLLVKDAVIEIYSPSGQYEGILKFKSTPDGNGEDICRTTVPCYLLVEDDGGLLVADYHNCRIVHFTSDGMFQKIVTTTFTPRHIAVVPNGKIATTSWRENKLFIIDMISGREILTVEIPQANAICYHEESDTLLVARCLKRKDQDTPDIRSGVIEQYCPTSGVVVSEVYRWASEEFNPRDMLVTNDGILIVAGAAMVKAFSIVVPE